MAQVGDAVSVHYTGTLDDGTVFDTSLERDPLQFTLGDGRMIAGFDKAVVGMKIGESKTFRITADEAYGPYREELIQVVHRSALPEGLEPQVGQQLTAQQPGGGTVVYTIIDVSESTVTLDANLRLAGEALTFDIQLMEIL